MAQSSSAATKYKMALRCRPGPGRAPPQDFTTTQAAALTSFLGPIALSQTPGGGVSLLSRGGKFALIFTALTGPTIPRTVMVEGAGDPSSMPGFSLGIASADGSIAMNGSPFPAP